MAEKLDLKETISILELTVSHMWSIAALVEVLEEKGLLLAEHIVYAGDIAPGSFVYSRAMPAALLTQAWKNSSWRCPRFSQYLFL